MGYFLSIQATELFVSHIFSSLCYIVPNHNIQKVEQKKSKVEMNIITPDIICLNRMTNIKSFNFFNLLTYIIRDKIRI